MHQQGWVANHDGNVTAKLADNRFLATPTATSKIDVDDRALLEVDADGKKIAGTSKIFGEIGLHLTVYARRPDVGAVVHAHPPAATAIACSSQNPIERPFLPEALVSLGPSIPKVAMAAPGLEACRLLAPHVESVDAVLIAGNGVLAWGKTVEQAYLRLELVEHLAKIALAAAPLGGVAALPDHIIGPLLEARSKAGLGLAAAKSAPRPSAGSRPVVACAPAPHANVATIAPGGQSKSELARLIREELTRVLERGK